DGLSGYWCSTGRIESRDRCTRIAHYSDVTLPPLRRRFTSPPSLSPLPHPPNRRQVIRIRRREDVLAVRLRNEIEISDRRRVERRDQAGVARLRDRAGRQPRIQIGVVGRANLELSFPNTMQASAVRV